MRLNYSIAATLGFVTCLSSFMLGLGQAGYILPVLMFIAAVSSFFLTDYHRVIRLGDWTVNVLVLGIVFLAFGEMLKNRGEDLAFSIARVLVFVEMVLLFREKAPRFCWQILIISLLQVLVATVFQQSLLFGILLLIYVFAGLCAFVLVFLQQENRYFRRHSFVGTFLDALKAEIAERQDRGRLARIALVTLLTGPLSIVFSFSNSNTGNSDTGRRRNPQAVPPDGKATPMEILRSLFAVFPNDQDVLARNRWETVETATGQGNDAADRGSDGGAGDVIAQKGLALVPQAGTLPFFRKTLEEPSKRFPLISEKPGFSAGTVVPDGLEGGQGELLRHLVRGTLFSLIVAVTFFCLVPRVGRIDFSQRSFRFGQDYWATAVPQPVGTVGFTEAIKLGSLGTILPHHREVMSIRFTKCPDGRIPPSGQEASETPYNEIHNATLFFRGVALDTYAGGTWRPRQTLPQDANRFGVREWPREGEWDGDIPGIQQAAGSGSFHLLLPGGIVQASESEKLFFEKGADMVGLQMLVQPLDTKVFFAPWPFFCRSDFRSVPLTARGGRVEEQRQRRRERLMIIYTTAFKKGVQLPIVPCQERVTRENLLQIPSRGLDALKNLARQWDRESRLPLEDVIGRARFMEQKFLASDQFQYKLGGTVRDYNQDPLEDFIGNNPTGHCEYFAGALALMLRSVGIHSRVIVGFKTYATNESSKGYMVRQSDAHAWVEVFLPPELAEARSDGSNKHWWRYGGWLRLDPSPSVEPTFIKSVSFSLTDLNQWINTTWNEFVLNMNSTRQTEWIYTPMFDVWNFFVYRVLNYEFWKRSTLYVFNYYRSIFSKAGRVQGSGTDWLYLAPAPIPILILGVLFVWLLRRWRSLTARQSSMERRRRATVEFYARMEKLLARIAPRRRSGETPMEYVRRAAHTDLTAPVVAAYYQVRFGGTELTDEQLVSVRTALDRLENKIKNA